MPSAVPSPNNHHYASQHRRQSSRSQTNLPEQTKKPPSRGQSPHRSLDFLPATAYVPPPPTAPVAVLRPRNVSTSSPTQSPRPRPRNVSTSSPSQSRSAGRVDLAPSVQNPNDPHDFYRQYHDAFDPAVPAPLHQAGIRPESLAATTDRAPILHTLTLGSANLDSDGSAPSRAAGVPAHHALRPPVGGGTELTPSAQTKPLPALPTGLRARKTSFKDLIARFDASPEDIPPMPTQHVARPTSRTASPMPYAPGHTGHSYASALPKRPTQNIPAPTGQMGTAVGLTKTRKPASSGTGSGSGASATVSLAASARPRRDAPDQGRQLLFGEVPTSMATGPTSPGYGIYSLRRRRGSEGSPMHSPNPMFPPQQDLSSSQEEASFVPHPPDRAPTHAYVGMSEATAMSQLAHRRANSDVSTLSSSRFLERAPLPSAIVAHPHSSPPDSSAKTSTGAQSRIPVSIRHQRIVSDSAATPRTSLTVTVSPSGGGGPEAAAHRFPSPTTRVSRKTGSPRRQPKSGIQIKSPNTRARGSPAVNGEKSPSLRANIISPPPKISPPLRSSRPRLPVSSASTAASRAKIAEKFQTMAKRQIDGKAVRRQRPPELSDIDLKARRMRITLALSRAKDGNELAARASETRGSSASRTDSLTASVDDSDDVHANSTTNLPVPAVVVDAEASEALKAPDGADAPDTADEHRFYAHDQHYSHDGPALTQRALKIVKGASHPAERETDSPTLGHIKPVLDASAPPALNTNLQPIRDSEEPQSAVTEGTVGTEVTDATMFEPEPQTETQQAEASTSAPSLLSQIHALRNPSVGSRSSSSSPVSAHGSDHADEVSVRLILRDTTYLDDVEAAEKGYRPMPTHTEAGLTPSRPRDRSSWSSSISDEIGAERRRSPTGEPSLRQKRRETPAEARDMADSHSLSGTSAANEHVDASHPDASPASPVDTYTIVNLVLQQQTVSGVVDQQLVDDIYHRIIQACPELAAAENVDGERVRGLCLQELDEHNRHWGSPEVSRSPSSDLLHSDPTVDGSPDAKVHHRDKSLPPLDVTVSPDGLPPPGSPPVPPSSYRAHRYKSSLDSAEDWAETSPSVGDWMQFAVKSPTEAPEPRRQSSLAQVISHSPQDIPSRGSEPGDGELPEGAASHDPDRHLPLQAFHPARRPTTFSRHSADQASWSAPVGLKPRSARAPPPARPLTSASQMSRRSSSDQALSSSPQPARVSDEQSSEQRRLKQRRNVMKELVDTEYSYARDMMVLCDIYKQTAVEALSDEDIKIIFGNAELVQRFSNDFLSMLKKAVKPAYSMDRPDRRKDGDGASIVQSSAASIDETADLGEAEKDERTRVGHAFDSTLDEMERVYTEYIRTRHAANSRLEALQSSLAVRQWLTECSHNSTDLTYAWSLDALLVKPIQRITKYPLLLAQLLEATPEGHPDLHFLRLAVVQTTEINVRINEVKKHTELVDQVLNRRRKDSDVRNGLTKALGRRAEKLRQQVGINEMYEDSDYAKLKISYDNNIAHLFLVGKDCQGYVDAVRQWVVRLCEVAAAAEAWVDVGHTGFAQAESRLRQFAVVVRGINSLALPDHLQQVTARVLEPMEKTSVMLERFKADSRGLIQKREKRLLDYNQFKNKKDRGEKLDKKMTERMEQWEALNLEAKERMKRLIKATADLIHGCQANLLQLHLDWLDMCRHKFSSAMQIPLTRINHIDIFQEWQEDFDYQEAAALSLSICNGSLLAEAVNMISFLSPGAATFGGSGNDSPRQPSWSNPAKRSLSTIEDAPPLLPLDAPRRNSSQSEDRSGRISFSFANGRIRAASAASGRTPRTPDMNAPRLPAPLGAVTPTLTSSTVSRPGTSTTGHSDGVIRAAPKLSLDAPSPSIGPLLVDSPPAMRHVSTSTFYSAVVSSGESPVPAPAPAAAPSPWAGPGVAGSGGSPKLAGAEDPSRRRGAGAALERESGVLFTAASVYEFNIDRSRQQGGFRYLTYVTGEIFDVIAEHGELWLAINQDDATREIGWIWNKHFAKLAQ